MFIVSYRPHNKMIMETEYYVFNTYTTAVWALENLPPLGNHIPEGPTPNPGVKWINEASNSKL